jgi:membrane protease YdiL (CAAX protease family)
MQFIVKIFWNKGEARVRAGWRLLIQLALLFMLTVPFAMFDSLFNDFLPESTIAYGDTILFPLWILLSSIISVWLVGRFVDRRKFADFGLRLNTSWWVDLGFGVVLAASMITGIFLVEQVLGWVAITGTYSTNIDGWTFMSAIILALVTFILIAASEELTARGYQIKNLAEGLNLRSLGPKWALALAVLLTSVLFGLGHAVNPDATVLSTSGLFLAGIFYGVTYVLTGQLALPIGFHIAWNFFENSVFGFPVSGENFGVSFISIQQNGPHLWTGGEFGPEAGLLSIGGHLVGLLVVAAWVRLKRGKVRLLVELSQLELRGNLD